MVQNHAVFVILDNMGLHLANVLNVHHWLSQIQKDFWNAKHVLMEKSTTCIQPVENVILENILIQQWVALIAHLVNIKIQKAKICVVNAPMDWYPTQNEEREGKRCTVQCVGRVSIAAWVAWQVFEFVRKVRQWKQHGNIAVHDWCLERYFQNYVVFDLRLFRHILGFLSHLLPIGLNFI